MKFESPMLAVKDIEVSKAFYRRVLEPARDGGPGRERGADRRPFAADAGSWAGLSRKTPRRSALAATRRNSILRKRILTPFGKAGGYAEIRYVHAVKGIPLGPARGALLTPDGHIIEVGESMKTVCRRFFGQRHDPRTDRTAHGCATAHGKEPCAVGGKRCGDARIK